METKRKATFELENDSDQLHSSELDRLHSTSQNGLGGNDKGVDDSPRSSHLQFNVPTEVNTDYVEHGHGSNSENDVDSLVSDVADQQDPDENSDSTLNPPDGGWGWAVCLACFLLNVINDGVEFTTGLVFAELLKDFRKSTAETSWILAIGFSTSFLTGPLVTALTGQFGCRVVTCVGTLVKASGFVISIFAPSVHFLYFSFGLLLGIGDGMMYVPGILCVTQYFKKRRALATGLCVAGTGIGTFIFSPLTAMLIEAFQWRGTLLVLAGLLLNCLACSLIYLPVSHKSLHYRKQTNKQYLHRIRDESKQDVHSFLDSQLVQEITEQSHSIDQNVILSIKTERRGSDHHVVLENVAAIKDKVETNNVKKCQNEKPSSLFWVCGVVLGDTYRRFRDAFSPQQFRNKAFTLYVISTFIGNLGGLITTIYLPVGSREAGLSLFEGAWVLSATGIASTAGRVGFGYISDKPWLNRLYLCGSSDIICGVATALVPWLRSFLSFMIYAVVVGVFDGARNSLHSVVIADIVGIQELPRAYGMTNFLAGVSFLIGPPAAGWLSDISGGYTWSFLASGATIGVSGVMLCTIPCIYKSWSKQ